MDFLRSSLRKNYAPIASLCIKLEEIMVIVFSSVVQVCSTP